MGLATVFFLLGTCQYSDLWFMICLISLPFFFFLFFLAFCVEDLKLLKDGYMSVTYECGDVVRCQSGAVCDGTSCDCVRCHDLDALLGCYYYKNNCYNSANTTVLGEYITFYTSIWISSTGHDVLRFPSGQRTSL